MSIFDPRAGMDPRSWLKEKTLSALQETAALVDLANEPDTTPWYAKKLRKRAARLAAYLAPVVALLHEAGQHAADHEEWGLLLDGGTAALARWCKRWDIADPRTIGLATLEDEEDDDEAEDKAEVVTPGIVAADEDRALGLRLDIYGARTRELVHADLPDAERRLELWLLASLWHSAFGDIAVVPKRFLPTDIGCSPEETAAAYRALYERGVIERVDGLPNVSPEALALRLVVSGRNDSKHPAPYREEKFGFPGARIGGQPTIGNVVLVPLPASLETTLPSWPPTRLAAALADLRTLLQERLGADRVYIETVEHQSRGAEERLALSLRCKLDEDDEALGSAVRLVTEEWAGNMAGEN